MALTILRTFSWTNNKVYRPGDEAELTTDTTAAERSEMEALGMIDDGVAPNTSGGPQPAINPRGSWDEETAYNALDVVERNGSSYIATEPTTGDDPEDGAPWSIFAEGGVPGPTGPEGPQGDPGADGADGMNGADGADGADGEDGTVDPMVEPYPPHATIMEHFDADVLSAYSQRNVSVTTEFFSKPADSRLYVRGKNLVNAGADNGPQMIWDPAKQPASLSVNGKYRVWLAKVNNWSVRTHCFVGIYARRTSTGKFATVELKSDGIDDGGVYTNVWDSDNATTIGGGFGSFGIWNQRAVTIGLVLTRNSSGGYDFSACYGQDDNNGRLQCLQWAYGGGLGAVATLGGEPDEYGLCYRLAGSSLYKHVTYCAFDWVNMIEGDLDADSFMIPPDFAP